MNAQTEDNIKRLIDATVDNNPLGVAAWLNRNNAVSADQELSEGQLKAYVHDLCLGHPNPVWWINQMLAGVKLNTQRNFTV